MNHYEILGVTPDSPHHDVKHHYRNLVKQYHPDLNPSLEAKILITKINEAYEVLSDPSKKIIYDWLLLGETTAAQPPTPPSSRETHRREYIRRKRAQEQHHWEQLLAWKLKFYKYQRYFAYVFLLLGTIYTYDFFFTEARGVHDLVKVTRNKYDTGVSLGFITFSTDISFFHLVKKRKIKKVILHYSRIMNVPVGVSADGLGYFKFRGTIHSFNNIPAFLLLIFAGLLFWQKDYSDWSLTIGLLPFFIMAFLFLLTYFTLEGLEL